MFGAEVLTFRRLVREIAARGRACTAARSGRSRATAWCARRSATRTCGCSRRQRAHHGFTAAAGELFAELGRSLVTPARFTRALRGWAAGGEAPAHAEELAALYSAYHRRLEALGRRDEQGHARAALDALRERPAAWGARPVLLYGFDDLDPQQLDAVETLAGRAEAEVWVALPYEAGRAAFAGHAATVELLKPLAARHVVLDDRSEHYAAPARRALHHLERRLFEGGGEPCSPNGAVRLLEAGGERAEAELVAAEVLELMREGVAPEDIAVLVREGGAAVEVLAAGLADYGVPVAPDARLCAGRARGSAPACSRSRARRCRAARAADVITWLRTPGKLADPDAADALDARVRRTEAATAADARRLWEGALPELDALARPRRPRARRSCSRRCWPRPRRSGPRRTAAAPRCSGPEEAADARTAAELRSRRARAALAGGGRPRAAGRRRRGGAGGARRGHGPPGRGARRRARRRRAGDPRAPLPRGLRVRAAGRRVPAPPVARAVPRRRRRAPRSRAPAGSSCAATRTCWGRSATSSTPASRGRRRCCSSPSAPPTRTATRVQASPFVADVRALFTDELWRERGTRLLAEVTWPPATAPTPHELRRAQAAAQRAPGAGGAGRARAARRCWRRSPRAGRRPRAALETFAACGVRWLVESLLKPAAGGARPGADAPRLARPRGARGDAARPAASARARRGSARTRSTRRSPSWTARSAPCARAAAASWRARAAGPGCARSRRTSCATCATRPSTAPGMEPQWLEWSFGREGDSARRAGAQRLGLLRHRAGSTGSTSTAAASRWCATTRARPSTPGRAGRRTGACRPRCTRWRRGSCSGSSRPARSTSRSARATGARAGSCRAGTPGRYVNGDVVAPEALDAALLEAREAALGAARGDARGPDPPVPVALLAERLRLPGHLPGRRGAAAEDGS